MFYNYSNKKKWLFYRSVKMDYQWDIIALLCTCFSFTISAVMSFNIWPYLQVNFLLPYFISVSSCKEVLKINLSFIFITFVNYKLPYCSFEDKSHPCSPACFYQRALSGLWERFSSAGMDGELLLLIESYFDWTLELAEK